jgi:hypothetical protein
MTNAAARVWDVTGVAGDNVKMELRNRLAGIGAIVDAEIEGLGCGGESVGEFFLRPIYPDQEAGFFGASEVVVPADRAARNYESMTR